MLTFKELLTEKERKTFLSDAYCQGADAFNNQGKNPYDKNTEPYFEWETGFLDARYLRSLTNGL